MQKYTTIAILGSFFCLWISGYLSENLQVIVGFMMIFSFGIFHGANDLQLIQNLSSNLKKLNFVKILVYYIVIVLLGAVFFYTIPWLALLMFIIVSSYHFGEQQNQYFEINTNKLLRNIFKFIYGIFVLLLLFNFHQNEVQKIVFNIINLLVPTNYVPLFLKLSGFVLLIFYLYLYINQEKNRISVLLEIFYLIVFTVIFASSSLIWGFAIYFILWHSIPSIIDQINFLYGAFSLKNGINYLKSAFLYWIVSLFGILLLYFFFKEIKLFNALFFSFLASITFPHAIVILKMFDKKK